MQDFILYTFGRWANLANEQYTGNPVVTLTAAADAGSIFAGWSGGGCSGTGNCVVTVNTDTAVTATFNTAMPGTLAFAQTAQSTAEGATLQVAVTRSGGTNGAVAVSYQTNNGTASAPGDYTSTSGSLNWADGDGASKQISVPIAADGAAEADETFTLTLSNPTNNATLGSSTHTVTVTDSGVFPPSCQFPSGYSTPGGFQAWAAATDQAFEGTCSLRSTVGLANNQTARIQTSGNYQAGNVSFWVRVASEASFDCFRFLVDGVRQSVGTSCASSGNPGISGTVDWQLITVALSAGQHTLTWEYAKDETESAGADAAWIDLVALPSIVGATQPTFTSAAPGGGTVGSVYSHTFVASGSPAPSFALQSGTFPPGLSLTGATLSGTPTQAGTFTGSVRASNSAGNVDQAFSIVIAASSSSLIFRSGFED